MNIFQRLVAGNPNRKTRLHDAKGQFVGWHNLAHLPRACMDLWRRRIIHRAVDSPWFTYNAVSYLKSILSPDWRVLEFGSGQSTIWFAERVKFVHSIEIDPYWHRHIQQEVHNKSLTNIRCDLVTEASYFETLNYPKHSFDLVIIDGANRYEAVRYALELVKPGGYLYFDNSDEDLAEQDPDHAMRPIDTFLESEGLARNCTIRRFVGFTVGYLATHEGMLLQFPVKGVADAGPHTPPLIEDPMGRSTPLPIIPKPYARTRSAAVLSLLAILGPVFGFFLELALAWNFGTTGIVDAYRVVSPLLIFGNLLAVTHFYPNIFVPIIHEKGSEGFGVAFTWTLFIACFGALAIPIVQWKALTFVQFLAPGLPSNVIFIAASLLTRFSKAFILIMLSGVLVGILHAYRRFWFPALIQPIVSMVVIANILLLGRKDPVDAIGRGFLIGYGMTYFFCLILVWRIEPVREISKWGIRKSLSVRSLFRMAQLSAPILIVLVLNQWSSLIINRVMSQQPAGTLALFGYAWKLLIPIAFAAYSIITVGFPSLSAAVGSNNTLELERLFHRLFRSVLCLAILICVFLEAARQPFLSLLFSHGRMHENDLNRLAHIYGLVLLSAPFGVIITLMQKMFYAEQKPLIPAYIEFSGALCYTVFLPIIAEYFGLNGVLLEVVTINVVLAISLLLIYKFRRPSMDFRSLLAYIFRLFTLASLILLLLTLISLPRFNFSSMSPAFSFLFQLGILAFVSVGTTILLAKWLKIPEVSDIITYIRWQLFKVRI